MPQRRSVLPPRFDAGSAELGLLSAQARTDTFDFRQRALALASIRRERWGAHLRFALSALLIVLMVMEFGLSWWLLLATPVLIAYPLHLSTSAHLLGSGTTRLPGTEWTARSRVTGPGDGLVTVTGALTVIKLTSLALMVGMMSRSEGGSAALGARVPMVLIGLLSYLWLSDVLMDPVWHDERHPHRSWAKALRRLMPAMSSLVILAIIFGTGFYSDAAPVVSVIPAGLPLLAMVRLHDVGVIYDAAIETNRQLM